LKANRVASQTLLVEPMSFGTDLDLGCVVCGVAVMCTKVFFNTVPKHPPLVTDTGDMAELVSKSDDSSGQRRRETFTVRCVRLGC